MTTSIGIIGNGYVGGAVAAFFRAGIVEHLEGCGGIDDCANDCHLFPPPEPRRIAYDVRVHDADPERSTHGFEAAATADFVFLCVPTPTEPDGKQDLSAVDEVFEGIEHCGGRGVVVLKSTVLPGTCRRLGSRTLAPRLVFWPEFLTARTAERDFANPESIVLGAESLETWLPSEEGSPKPLLDLILVHWPGVAGSIVCSNWETAELVKYARNTFYAAKLGFWNEIHQLAARLGLKYSSVQHGVQLGGWVNPMHCDVPGPDGKLGFGGACLPKDSQALVRYARERGVGLSVLHAALRSNERTRGQGTPKAHRKPKALLTLDDATKCQHCGHVYYVKTGECANCGGQHH